MELFLSTCNFELGVLYINKNIWIYLFFTELMFISSDFYV
jgi:hypothetical protein